MAKKKGYYAIWGPEFKGTVRTNKEYKEKVNGKKSTFGKYFTSQQEALQWIDNFIGKTHKMKEIEGYYAVHTPEIKGIVTTLQEYLKYIKGRKNSYGKKCPSEKQAQQWLDNFEPPSKVTKEFLNPLPTPHVIKPAPILTNAQPFRVPVAQEVIMYIDGGFKDGIGKYGIVAYSPKKTERIYQNFGHVFDQNFNDLKNTGAELMACLRALEWAFSNGMKVVQIIYDFEGIEDHLVKVPVHTATSIYQQMITGFQRHMQIHFLHIRHGNKELHKEAHNLTQLVL